MYPTQGVSWSEKGQGKRRREERTQTSYSQSGKRTFDSNSTSIAAALRSETHRGLHGGRGRQPAHLETQPPSSQLISCSVPWSHPQKTLRQAPRTVINHVRGGKEAAGTFTWNAKAQTLVTTHRGFQARELNVPCSSNGVTRPGLPVSRGCTETC